MRPFIPFLLLALAPACTGAPPSDEPEPECTLDSQCAAGELCDVEAGACGACEVVLGLPEPNDTCLPRCGNEKGVGMPCTAGGGECNGNDIRALFCTIDQVPDAELHMCTGPCADDADCGTNSVCTGDPADVNSPKGCVPAACAEGEGGEGEGEGEDE